MGVDANKLFMHQPNDSAETIKLGMSPVGESGSTNSESSGGVEEDEITKCISDLNIFDLLHNNPPSSSDDNEEGAGASGNMVLDGRMGVERLTVIGSGYQQQQQQQQQQQSSLALPASPTVVMVPGQNDSGALAQPPGGCGIGAPKHRTPLRKLKSSLKLASQSQSSCSSTSLSSSKSVRFAPQLATVKRFDLNSEPMSISNENSPALTSLDQLLGMESTVMDKFWFGAPVFNRLKSKIPLSKGVPKFTLDYDSDDSDDKQFDDDTADDDYSSFDSSEEEDGEDADEYGEAPNLFGNGCADGDTVMTDRFTISHWELQSSNLSSFQAVASTLPLQEQLFTFLQGHNIKLNKVSLLDMHTVRGTLYVANLHFEKFIEVKFSFNEWKDIHYVTAQYLRTVTSKIDEFKFTIDLSSYKYFMQVKNLLYCDPKKRETHCPITMALCCRYDVNGETYYDNNNYENYQINACCLTVPSMPTVPVGRTRTRAKLLVGSYSSCKDSSPKPTGVYSPIRNNKLVPLRKSLSHDFLLNFSQKHSPVYPGHSSTPPSNTSSTARPSIGRTFSEDTDYFNTSPLKHIYHFDSSKQCSSTDSSSTIVESEHSKRSSNNDISPHARKGFTSPPSDNDYIHDSLDSATISSVTSLRTPRNRREFLSSPDLSTLPSETDDSHVQNLHIMSSKKNIKNCNDFRGVFQGYELYPAASAPPSINSSGQNYNNSFLSKTACVSQSPSANQVP